MVSYNMRIRRNNRRKELKRQNSTSRNKPNQSKLANFAGIWYALILSVIISFAATLIMILVWGFTQNTKLKLVPPNPELPQPPSDFELYVFNKSIVSSDASPCSVIGSDIFRENGSAVDAAIAALFCNGVVNSHSMGLGGGFMMMIYDRKRRKAEALLAREEAPLAAHKDMFNKFSNINSAADNSQPSRTGGLAIGIPGELRGYWEAWNRYGKLPWPNLVRPAINLCYGGYKMTKHQYDMLRFRKNAIYEDQILRETFIDPETNTYRRIGSIIKPVKLCRTLELIAKDGGEILNNGALTRTLVDDIKNVGGIISELDLNKYRPEWAEPVSVTLHSGQTVYSVPPPGAGVLLTYILSILDGYNITAPKNLDEEILTMHRIVEAFKFAFAKRTELADPRFVNVTQILEKLTSPKYGRETRENIRDDTTYEDPKYYGAIYSGNDDQGTAHISIISPDGDAVSVTSSINLYFGAGVSSPGTGIIFNSVMDDFSIPGELNYFGLPSSTNNFIEPFKRPLSSAAPTIIVDPNGSVRLVIGASGGTKIPTASAWVIIRYFWFEESLKMAIDASRIHHQLLPMEVSYEYGVLQQIIEGLEKIGHKTERYRERGSIVCAIAQEDKKILSTIDFRKGGEIAGLN